MKEAEALKAYIISEIDAENLKAFMQLVRCIDCENFIIDTERDIEYCKAWGSLTGNGKNDYCSYGVKK